MTKDKALAELEAAHEDAVKAERAAVAAQERKRAAVRAAFNAGCNGPDVAGVLGSSVQWAYKVKAMPPSAVA
ncbi:hypothetical protein [Pseudarthrobacter sp. MEB009]|uniref:hypothetical protein n=1 Tax=Pseudarthrobacter sp. MEB009 TaxID=3040326 RepID=UPI0025524F1F|nr:hypothetical protein [Pseudarthrobacter sp. MEB009]